MHIFADGVCVLRLFDINVAMKQDDFLQHEGLLCVYNETAGGARDGLIECLQPVQGQYLTIMNLVHLESETVDADYEKCLQICEVLVYVEGEFLISGGIRSSLDFRYLVMSLVLHYPTLHHIRWGMWPSPSGPSIGQ